MAIMLLVVLRGEYPETVKRLKPESQQGSAEQENGKKRRHNLEGT